MDYYVCISNQHIFSNAICLAACSYHISDTLHFYKNEFHPRTRNATPCSAKLRAHALVTSVTVGAITKQHQQSGQILSRSPCRLSRSPRGDSCQDAARNDGNHFNYRSPRPSHEITAGLATRTFDVAVAELSRIFGARFVCLHYAAYWPASPGSRGAAGLAKVRRVSPSRSRRLRRVG